jgi:hypothetical protein
MRYVLQFVVPALIVAVVVYLVARRRREASSAGASDFLNIMQLLIVGAVVAWLAFVAALELTQ